ncbi:hypothetical protein Glove_42g31 [Diversispora epigaea]|uniref:Fork-head domain-containing protein n=1 Tax=Diversispora epigaea TaxID=1348612 RepID=A0A397JJG8_9GLOM|nr:hypothetical protein Glove_42g31 [Diversispora epigaea]
MNNQTQTNNQMNNQMNNNNNNNNKYYYNVQEDVRYYMNNYYQPAPATPIAVSTNTIATNNYLNSPLTITTTTSPLSTSPMAVNNTTTPIAVTTNIITTNEPEVNFTSTVMNNLNNLNNSNNFQTSNNVQTTNTTTEVHLNGNEQNEPGNDLEPPEEEGGNEDSSSEVNDINDEGAEAKPPYTYTSLIGQAVLAAPNKKRPLNEIYKWISDTYPFYKMENKGWQNSIRHNLTLCPAFRRRDRDDGVKGKGAFWTIPDEYEMCFINGVFKNDKAKEVKLKEESAPPSGFSSSSNVGLFGVNLAHQAEGTEGTVTIPQAAVPEPIPPPESSVNLPHSSRLSISSANPPHSSRLSISSTNLPHTSRLSISSTNLPHTSRLSISSANLPHSLQLSISSISSSRPSPRSSPAPRPSPVPRPSSAPRQSRLSSSSNTTSRLHRTISGRINRSAHRQSKITYNSIMKYIQENGYLDTKDASEEKSSTLSIPYNYVNMAEVENDPNEISEEMTEETIIEEETIGSGFTTEEETDTETTSPPTITWELGVTEYCGDTGLEYNQRTYFASQLNVPEICDYPNFVYTGCMDPEKLIQVDPDTRNLCYIDQGIFNPW